LNYITNDGYRRVTAELKILWFDQRPKIVKAINVAAAEGDRSENAEYIYRKKEIRELDRKIRYLEKHLKDINIVLDKPTHTNKVFFGAWVTLNEIKTAKIITYRIVGMIESRPECNEISMHTPVAKALLGKSLDSEVNIKVPSGEIKKYIISAVKY